jgi:predicted DCC family thiol-disulfide oxidoreductase YuxK
VVLFDGVCNLCSAGVQWIIRHDASGIFHFATLQSRHVKPLETIVLIDGQREYERSTATLHILRRLPRFKWLAYLGVTIPPPIRDQIYDFIARRRYFWFGKSDRCTLPTPEIAARFIDPPEAA